MKERILLIEDDPAVARLAAKRLGKAGYVVDVARNGADGLARYDAGSYGVVIVDYRLPGEDGLEVVRRLASVRPLPPTMMVTGSGNEEIAVAAMKLGVGDYIVKDIAGGYLDLLPVAVQRVIDQHRLARQKRQAEEDLKAEKALTEAALNALQDAFWVLDLEGRLLRHNRSLGAVTGYSDEEISSMRPEDFFAPEDHQRVREAMGRVLRDGHATLEVTVVTKEGRRIPYEFSGSLLRDSQAEPFALCGVARDISRRELVERGMSRSQKLEWIGRLAAGIAHEISSPVQYVRQNTCFLQEAFGELEGLLEKSGRLLQAVKSGAADAELAAEIEAAMEDADLEYLVDEVPKAIRQSLEGIERVTKMVGAMKEFSMPGDARKQDVDLNRAIENIVTVSRNEWKYVADVVTELDPELGPVPCLPDDFYRAMLEQVIKAAQAIAESPADESRTKGTITLSTRRDGDWAEIRVGDTGRGTTFVVRLPIGDPSGSRGNIQQEEMETAC